MRHGKKVAKLGRPSAARRALLNSLAMSLFKYDRITTTLPKAKALRPFAERLITYAKRDTLHSKRLVLRSIKDRKVVNKLFSKIGPKYKETNGGYTRVIRYSNRLGDNAPTAIIELV